MASAICGTWSALSNVHCMKRKWTLESYPKKLNTPCETGTSCHWKTMDRDQITTQQRCGGLDTCPGCSCGENDLNQSFQRESGTQKKFIPESPDLPAPTAHVAYFIFLRVI